MKLPIVLPAVLLLSVPAIARAQTADVRRLDTSIGFGYANTWDDEGSIGTGSSASADATYHLTPRVGIGVAVERVSHSRDAGAGALTFDGRSLLASARAQFRFGSGAVQPIVQAGF